MRKYQKRDMSILDLQGYVLKKTGGNIQQLDNFGEYWVKYMAEAANKIREAVRKHIFIFLYGDSDGDGINSMVIALSILMKLGCIEGRDYAWYCPDNEDGYGIYADFVNRYIPDKSLVILMDNGISAIEALRALRIKKCEPIIIDHHLAGKELPPEDILIIDPEQFPEHSSTGNCLCAAGEMYMLACHMFPDDYVFKYQMACFGGIGEVTDVMPLLGCARQIVKTGIAAMMSGYALPGLQAVINKFELQKYMTSKDIAFSLGPAMNAMKRMYTSFKDQYGFHTGAMEVVRTLLSSGDSALLRADYIYENNQQRKALSAEITEKAVSMLSPTGKVNFIAIDDKDGKYAALVGPTASKLVEKNGRPSFVMAPKVRNGKIVLVGSSRSDDDASNNVKEMLDAVAPYLLTHGGHPGAAGFSLLPENFDKVKNALESLEVKPHTQGLYYDLDLDPKEALATRQMMDYIEPMGKGIEEPLFCISTTVTEYRRFGGKNKPKNNVGFNVHGLDVVWWNGAPVYYDEMKMPKQMRFYGTLRWNMRQDTPKAQFVVDDAEAA